MWKSGLNQLCGTQHTPLPRLPTSTALSTREKGSTSAKYQEGTQTQIMTPFISLYIIGSIH